MPKAKKVVAPGPQSSFTWKYLFILLVLFVIANMYIHPPFSNTSWLRFVSLTSSTGGRNPRVFSHGRDTGKPLSAAKGMQTNDTETLNCDNCFLHDFSYTINNDQICSRKDDKLDLLILVMTKHDQVLRRNVLRRTWLSYSKNNTANVRHAFVLGGTSNKELQTAIEHENINNRDIIQENFVDSYQNLTLKTIMIFKWASTFCRNARFVMKTDDDMYVNVSNLVAHLRTQNTSHTKLMGVCWSSGPIRNVKSKWYVSVDMYPHKSYPKFCSGTGYVTSVSTAAKLYNVSKHVPFFYLEDVYVGMCLKKIGGVAISVPGFMKEVEGRANKGKACTYKNKTFITGHGFSPELIEYVWEAKC